MIFNKILLITLIIINIYIILYFISSLFYKETETKQEKPKEERESYYLKLQNMTTQEILLFKRKEDFIKDVGCYDILREFYNDKEIIDKVYPNYKRLD